MLHAATAYAHPVVDEMNQSMPMGKEPATHVHCCRLHAGKDTVCIHSSITVCR